MSLPIMLDVAIGLVFTYVLLAIVVSGLQEAIAGWLALRGKHPAHDAGGAAFREGWARG